MKVQWGGSLSHTMCSSCLVFISSQVFDLLYFVLWVLSWFLVKVLKVPGNSLLLVSYLHSGTWQMIHIGITLHIMCPSLGANELGTEVAVVLFFTCCQSMKSILTLENYVVVDWEGKVWL